MQFQAEVAQTSTDKSFVDDFKGRHLFGDKQDLSPQGDVVGDDVPDSLRFPCAWRPLKHEIAVQTGSMNCHDLARVRIQWCKDRRCVDLAVDFSGIKKRGPAGIGIAGRVDQMADERRSLERFGSIRQVFPHQVLGKREGAQKDLLHDLKARHVLHLVTDMIPDTPHVDSAAVFRQLSRQLRQVDAEVLPKHLQ